MTSNYTFSATQNKIEGYTETVCFKCLTKQGTYVYDYLNITQTPEYCSLTKLGLTEDTLHLQYKFSTSENQTINLGYYFSSDNSNCSIVNFKLTNADGDPYDYQVILDRVSLD